MNYEKIFSIKAYNHKSLQGPVSILRIEARHISRISTELDSKLESFTQISNVLFGKLESLRNLIKTRFEQKDDAREFADKISASWELANKQVCEEYARIRVASRTLSGTPLASLLQRIRRQSTAAKLSLDIKNPEAMTDKHCILKGLSILEEITRLIKQLEKCDEKVQQYLSICKMTPYLLELDSAVDAYAKTNELLPPTVKNSSCLTIFPILTRLLTEELLGKEPVNPYHVLASNAPRKPVFITKNTIKRKMDIPALSANTKIPKNSYLSNFQQNSLFAGSSI
ncbi:uncharacterized protein LOC107224483 [Neodiprion lecontei]|uniref:Uncharacterized protein LOC107224483 n=1 Tax=Neodiprion lecontei TaxID=441921 RepID=A0ABM3GQQ7_NEOLC|nr:uncharacterized protein LOC107224483 [Neodiprion lecontei]